MACQAVIRQAGILELSTWRSGMNRLYKITARYKNNVEVEQEVMSFNALDAMEEWSVNHESEVDEILGVNCEFIRTVFNYEHP